MSKFKKQTRKDKDALSKKTVAANPLTTKRSSGLFNTEILPGILAAVFGFLLYAGTLNYGFTLDDVPAITGNKYVKEGLSGIKDIVQSAYWSGFRDGSNALYRPLSLALFAVQWEFFPNNPVAGHFINVLLFALTGFFLFRLLNKIFPNKIQLSFLATLFFMAHPIHTEVVANIKSCDEILGFLFSVLSLTWLLDYQNSGKNKYLVFSVISFFFALLSKENSITWLAIFSSALYIFRNESLRKSIQRVIPHVAGACCYLLIMFFIQKGSLVNQFGELTNNILFGAAGDVRIATALFVLAKYIWLLLFPVHMSMDYSFAEIQLMHFSDLKVLVSIALILALIAIGIFQLRKKDAIGFGILAIGASLSIVSNLLFLTGTIMADRLLYLPSFGFVIVLALLLTRLIKSQYPDMETQTLLVQFKNNPLLAIASLAILVFYSINTLERHPVWKNNLTLMSSGVKDAPNSAYIHFLYSNALISSVNSSEASSRNNDSIYNLALAGYAKAISIQPTKAIYYNEMASTYRKKKMIPEAINHYDLALKYDAKLPQAYNGKGVLLFEQKKYREALDLFAASVRLNAVDAVSLRNLGSCYLVLGDNQNAIANFNKSLLYDPYDPLTVEYLGYAYDNLGEKEKAKEYSSKARQLREKK